MPHSAAAEDKPADRDRRPVVVLKFGGTSVEDAAAVGRVVDIVGQRPGQEAVVVVSALAGVTDQLLAAGEHAACGALPVALQVLQSLRDRHHQMTRALLPNSQIAGVWAVLERELDGLARLL